MISKSSLFPGIVKFSIFWPSFEVLWFSPETTLPYTPKFLSKKITLLVESNYVFLMVLQPLRGQTVHWIGAQFCVCMFLDSRDKPLNMFKSCRNGQRNWKNKRRTKGASLSRNPLTMQQNAQFGFVMKRETKNQHLVNINNFAGFKSTLAQWNTWIAACSKSSKIFLGILSGASIFTASKKRW